MLYQDDFSSPGSGWTINSGSKGAAKYDHGALVMQVAAKNWLLRSTSASGELSNIHVEVTAASTGQAADVGFGVMCGYSDESYFYYLGITRSDYYALMKRENGMDTILTDANNNWVCSIRITQGAASYRVGADGASDGTLTLYSDGQQMATTNDTSYKSGILGLFVAGASQVPAEMRFTDLLATALP